MAENVTTQRQTPGAIGAYVKNVRDTAKSFWEGMSVTLSYMFRKPITTQYPDRVPVPVRDTIPPRYRGFLEVDMDICTACQACERACPIAVINIDIGKCMYCGLCVEPCPTGAIQHTREFEGAVQHFNNLTLRFVPDPLVPAVPYKPPKGSDAFPRRALGEITRALIAAWDAPPPPFPSKEQLEGDSGAAHGKPKQAGLDPTAMGRQLAAKALQVKEDKPKLAKVFEEAMAGTDCGDCGYADCKGYSEGLASGKDFSPEKCAPGRDAAAGRGEGARGRDAAAGRGEGARRRGPAAGRGARSRHGRGSAAAGDPGTRRPRAATMSGSSSRSC